MRRGAATPASSGRRFLPSGCTVQREPGAVMDTVHSESRTRCVSGPPPGWQRGWTVLQLACITRTISIDCCLHCLFSSSVIISNLKTKSMYNIHPPPHTPPAAAPSPSSHVLKGSRVQELPKDSGSYQDRWFQTMQPSCNFVSVCAVLREAGGISLPFIYTFPSTAVLYSEKNFECLRTYLSCSAQEEEEEREG